jgi:hypothetical protein
MSVGGKSNTPPRAFQDRLMFRSACENIGLLLVAEASSISDVLIFEWHIGLH